MGHPERAEQTKILNLLRSLGAEVYVSGTTRRRGDYQGTMQSPGIPDIEAFLPRPRYQPFGDGPERRLLKVEVKAPARVVAGRKRAKGRLSQEQEDYRDLCLAAAVDHVHGDVDDVIAWLIAHGYLRPESVGHYHLKGAEA